MIRIEYAYHSISRIKVSDMLIKLAAYLIALSRYIADEVEELHNERRKHVLSLHGADIDAARSKYNKRVAKIHSKLADRSQRCKRHKSPSQQAAQASRDKVDRLLDIDAARSKYNKRVAKIHSKLAGRRQRAVELYAKQQAAQASRDKADRLLSALK